MIYLPRFRAWDIKNKKMGEPDIIINNGRIDEIKIWGDETVPDEETDWRETSDFSLMMSSNVLDVKKKEIYDLDILKSTASEFPEDHKYWIDRDTIDSAIEELEVTNVEEWLETTVEKLEEVISRVTADMGKIQDEIVAKYNLTYTEID